MCERTREQTDADANDITGPRHDPSPLPPPPHARAPRLPRRSTHAPLRALPRVPALLRALRGRGPTALGGDRRREHGALPALLRAVRLRGGRGAACARAGVLDGRQCEPVGACARAVGADH